MGVTSAIRNLVTECVLRMIGAGVQGMASTEVQRTLEYLVPQLMEFRQSPQTERQSHYDHAKQPIEATRYYRGLRDRLAAAGVSVVDADVDISGFERWLATFPEIRKHYESMGDVSVEKCLEHYLTSAYLEVGKGDVYIDIGAAGSPWATILKRRGVRGYRLDLSFPQGVHGTNIGADAGCTNLPRGFATALAAHCAYECFMGDADTRLVSEASRILNQEGRYAIIPLYLDESYFILTSPYCNQKNVTVESGAKRVWREDVYRAPFSRHYSPESFRERVYSTVPEEMDARVVFFRNLGDVMKHYNDQRVYCWFMFYCVKHAR